MNKVTVHYVSLRSYPEFAKEKRRNPPSAQKVDYVIESLNKLGYKVNYISISESKNDKFYSPKKLKLSDNTDFYLCPNVPGKYRESFTFRWLTHIYAPMHIKRGDILLVYHTNGMRNDLLRKLADKYKMTFIYEVEELYEYAHENVSEALVEEEISFLQCPDKYMFCSEILAETVNRRKLPYTVLEGYYKYSKKDVEPFNDGKIHCVYGGIIDEVKGGAFRAVQCAKYLPDNYVVHILGFGEIGKLKDEINKNKDADGATVIYEGLKSGEEYIKFLSKCDIGLSLMTMREDINNTSFPSKLVLYLACGLRVAACKVKILEISQMSKLITFYDTDSPEEIARAIQSIDIGKPYDSREIMSELDNRFLKELSDLLRK